MKLFISKILIVYYIFNVYYIYYYETFLALEKSIGKFLSYGEQKIQNDGLEAIDVTFLEVLAEMLKEIRSKMIKFAEPIMILAKNILALKVKIKFINSILIFFFFVKLIIFLFIIR